MQNAPSSQSIKSTQQTKADVKTSDKSSSSAKQGDDTKKTAGNTDHTTVSTSFCGCKKDKCDAFFDKLLCYLEKQSDLIAKCCAHGKDHRRDSFEKLTNSQEINHNKDPKKNEKRDTTRHSSPCKDDPEPTFHRKPSVETQRSVKGRNKDCDDESVRPSRYKSQYDFESDRQHRVGDKPCNIYVEVCPCQKDKRTHASRSSHRTNNEPEPDQYSYKQKAATPPQRQPSGKNNEYGIDCLGCEDKVSYFFKLAEEICQGYMKQCQEQDNNRTRSNHSGRKNSREDFGNQVPSRPYQSQPYNEDSDENYMKPEKLSNEYGRTHAKPIAIEIDCLGTKEEIIVEPCQCVDSYHGRGKPTPAPSRVESHGPRKSCLEVFEERYGKMLRELHAQLFPDGRQVPPPGYPPQGYQQPAYPPPGYPPQGYPPQGYPQPGYPNPYGDGAPQPLPLQQNPPQPPQQAALPKNEDPPKDSKQSDDSSDDRKKKKKKDKKDDKKKKKASKDS